MGGSGEHWAAQKELVISSYFASNQTVPLPVSGDLGMVKKEFNADVFV